LLFSTDPAADPQTPLFIEINYYFGRTGLGGSEAYYRILMEEIRNWIRQLPSGRRSVAEAG
jgi:ribosomal protein S6--L-glutamate ligase